MFWLISMKSFLGMHLWRWSQVPQRGLTGSWPMQLDHVVAPATTSINEYDAADYDSAAERGTTAKCQVTESWARPLAHVTSVGLLGVGPLTGFRKNRFAAGDLALTFSDGFEAAIPGQPTASGADLEPSERFFEAVRSAISF